MAEKLEKIVVLKNEIQAQVLESVLKDRAIPHVIQSYYSRAYDGLFQMSSGWGHVEAPAQFKEEILSILQEMEQGEPMSEGSDATIPVRARWYQRAIVFGLLGLVGLAVMVAIISSAPVAYLGEGIVIFLILSTFACFLCKKHRVWVIVALAAVTVIGVIAVVHLSMNHLTFINDTEYTINRVHAIIYPYDFPLAVGPFVPGWSHTVRFPGFLFGGKVTVYGQFDEGNGFFGSTEPEDYDGRLTVRIRSDGSIATE